MEDTFSLTAIGSSKAQETLPVTSQEEKELRRVYDFLCDYQRKIPLKREINELLDWLENSKVRSASTVAAGITVNTTRLESTTEATQNRIDELRRQIGEIDANPAKKISCGDVFEILRHLKQKITRKEVEEIVWECDEDLDQCLDWSEFKLMFTRNIIDKSGLEPSRMVSHLNYP